MSGSCGIVSCKGISRLGIFIPSSLLKTMRLAAGSLRAFSLLSLAFLLCAPILAEYWPAWRGPAGTGVSGSTGLPIRWSPTENVRWARHSLSVEILHPSYGETTSL